MQLDPLALPLPERYGLLISVIQPRPIAWVSTVDAQGRTNLAPFSFFTGISANPMLLCFAPARDRKGRKKDTLANVEATRQFVVNAATEANGAKMVQSSAEYPPERSEFDAVGLTPLPSVLVRPPRVKESPVHLECELERIITFSEGPAGGSLVVGRVLLVHVDDALWKEGRIHHEDLRALGRLEGSWYTRVTDAYQIERPRP